MSITIISDSKRHRYLYEYLKDNGYDTVLYDNSDALPETIDSDIIIFPIPSLNQNGLLNLNGNTHLTIESAIDRTSAESLIITCNYECKQRRWVDINKFEAFTSLNAVPSAEGAIFEAMKNSDITLFGSNALVTGYGRIGKIIADRLKHFGANVTIAARKPKDIYAAESVGLKTSDFSALENTIQDYDFIFQTVPYPILTKSLLKKTTALIIEISSKCAGTDIAFANKNKNKVIYCPGIPEKYSSKTAAEILKISVIKIIHQTPNN